MIPLVCYIFICRLGRRNYFINVIIISLLHAISCTPTFSVIALVGILPIVAIMHSYKSIIKILPALGIFFFIILLNWHESLFAKYLVAPYSMRGDTVHKVPFEIVNNLLFVGLGIAGGILSFIANRIKGFRIIFALILGIFMPIIAYYSVIYLSILSPLRPLTFSYFALACEVYLLLALIIGIGLAEDAKLFLNLKFRSYIIFSRSFLFIIIGSMALAQFAVLKVQTPVVWLIEGGLSTLTGALDQLEKRNWLPSKPVRVVSVRYRLGGLYAAAAGLDTLDGQINISAINPYWKYILKSRKVYSAHPGLRLDEIDLECCDHYDFNKFADIDLLRIANVGYVLSIVPLIGSGITQVAGPQGIGDLPRSYDGIFDRLEKSVRQIIFSSKIRIYALDTPLERIYPISKLIISKANNSENDFFELIKKNALNKIAIVRENDLPDGLARNEGTLIIEKWALVKDGVKIDVKSGSGFVVFNSPYLPFWNAYADGKKQITFSVNNAQMAAYIPKNTKRFDFKYERPSLKDTIFKTLH